MEEVKETNEVKQEKKRLSPDATVLLTIGTLALITVVAGIVGVILKAL